MEDINLPVDTISSLPDNIIESILTRLSIRDAVRTSILSKKWKFIWATIPKLVFRVARKESCDSLVSSAMQVLFLHKGPILEFTLAIRKVENLARINKLKQLVLFLSRSSVESFTLNVSEVTYYKLPSPFFSFLYLTHLDLKFCEFKPPQTFKGFSRLKTLKFDEVDIAAEVLEGLIPNCPLLESLTIISSRIISYKIFDHYMIDYPRLKYLCSIYAFRGGVVGEYSEGVNSYFIELFNFLSVTLEHLDMDYRFFQFLAVGNVPNKLPVTLAHLRVLKLIDLCFEELDQISFALCLIRSSPNLKIIEFQNFQRFASKGSGTSSSHLLDYSDISLNQLVELRMGEFTGIQLEIDFVKFILANSPVLKRVRIKRRFDNVADGLQILKQITEFPRVSPLARIIFDDPLLSSVPSLRYKASGAI